MPPLPMASHQISLFGLAINPPLIEHPTSSNLPHLLLSTVYPQIVDHHRSAATIVSAIKPPSRRSEWSSSVIIRSSVVRRSPLSSNSRNPRGGKDSSPYRSKEMKGIDEDEAERRKRKRKTPTNDKVKGKVFKKEG